MQNAGAVFGLVYNNEPGAPIAMGEDNPLPNPIPAGMISLEAGLAMVDVAGTLMYIDILKTIGFEIQADWQDVINDESTFCPCTRSDILEPDLSAPGTDILALYAGEN